MGAPFNLKIIDAAAPAEIVSTPSYTDIFNEVMGTAATDQDGFATDLASLATRITDFETDVQASDASGDLAGAVANLDSADPAALDATIENYTGTIPTGKQILADGESLAVPQLLELPISLDYGSGPVAPPAQVSIDLGTVKLGSATIVHVLGSFIMDKHGLHGLNDATLANGDPRIFEVVYVDRHSTDTVTRAVYNLNITPAIAGTWVAQVNTHDTNKYGFAILTFSLIVVP